jgi:hypothetical protein
LYIDDLKAKADSLSEAHAARVEKLVEIFKALDPTDEAVLPNDHPAHDTIVAIKPDVSANE